MSTPVIWLYAYSDRCLEQFITASVCCHVDAMSVKTVASVTLTKSALYLMKNFVVETLYYCNHCTCLLHECQQCKLDVAHAVDSSQHLVDFCGVITCLQLMAN